MRREKITEELLLRRGVDPYNARRISLIANSKINGDFMRAVLASKSKYDELLEDNNGIPVTVEKKDYCIIKNSLCQPDPSSPLVAGYGYDKENNGFNITWSVSKEFWDEGKREITIESDSPESLIRVIVPSQPENINFDRWWEY